MIAVLLTSVGTDSAITVCESLRSYFGAELWLAGVDVKPSVPALPLLDHFEQVPPRVSPEYLPSLSDLACRTSITHVWPLSTADQEIVAAARNGVLRDYTLMCSDFDRLRIANDKIRLLQFCRSRGFPAPSFEVVSDVAALESAAQRLGYPANPVVIRIATGAGAEGLKIVHADCTDTQMFLSRLNRDLTLERAIIQLQNAVPWPRILLTEYLPGDEFSVDVLRYQGRWHGGVVRRRDASIFGLATDAVVVDHADALELARQLTEALDLEFISNLQFRCNAKGEVRIMEVNPRVPGTIGLSIAAGANLPAIALALTMGHDVTLAPPRIGTRILRYFAGTVLTP